jgi:hypothetical protein
MSVVDFVLDATNLGNDRGILNPQDNAALAATTAHAADTHPMKPQTTERHDCRPRLSFEQANEVCRRWVPIGGEVFDCMRQLAHAGFKAFLPRQKYIESFSEDPKAIETHRRCVVETAKERLGQPWPIRIYDEDLKHLYFSPFLQQLREERDRTNGVPIHELSNRYGYGESAWRREVDPCLRRLIQLEAWDKEIYEERRAAMYEQERQALKEEAARHSTGLGKCDHTFDSAGRYRFFRAVMERDAAPLGFHYDNKKSRRDYPIFSKSVTDDWHLCWAIEERRSFFHSPFEGNFSPHLELRSRQLVGTLSKSEPGEYLHIRYAGSVLSNGYWTFFNLDELETAIKAHLYLYSLIAPAIEGGITEVLHK